MNTISLSRSLVLNVILWYGFHFYGCSPRANIGLEHICDGDEPSIRDALNEASTFEFRIRQMFDRAALCVDGVELHERQFRVERERTFRIIWVSNSGLYGMAIGLREYAKLMIESLGYKMRIISVSVSHNSNQIKLQ